MSPQRLKAYFFILAAIGIWSIATVVIKLTLSAIEPIPFLLYRFALSAGAALLFFATNSKKFSISSKSDALMFVICSILGTSFGLGLLFIGLNETTVLSLSLITLSAPLLAQAAGTIFLKEHLTKREKIGTMIALGGTLLTIIQPILESGGEIGNLKGNILILLYMLGDTVSLILLKKLLRKGYSATVLTHGSFIIGFFTLLPVSLVIAPASEILSQIINLPFIYHLGVIYMALLSGTVAYWARARGQKTIEVGEAALLGYLSPIISSVLAVFLLGDRIGFVYIAGAAIIFSGVILAETKPKRV